MPETRKAIKLRAKKLYIQSKIYELDGFDRKARSFKNQSYSETNKLRNISRFWKRKEIHRANRSIRELEGKINPLREDQVNQESTIKEALFKEFLGGL